MVLFFKANIDEGRPKGEDQRRVRTSFALRVLTGQLNTITWNMHFFVLATAK